jgi:hypothetical protein
MNIFVSPVFQYVRVISRMAVVLVVRPQVAFADHGGTIARITNVPNVTGAVAGCLDQVVCPDPMLADMLPA